MRVIVLCGLPGVGKLTVAKGLARLRGYRVFHNHLVFDAVEALFPFGSTAFVELRERLWLELLSRAVRERVGDIIFTIAGDKALRADFLVTLVSALSQMEARVCCVELICSVEELEERLISGDRSRFGKLNSVERFRQLDSVGAFPRLTMPPGTITIDTSGLSAEEATMNVDAEVNRACCVGHQPQKRQVHMEIRIDDLSSPEIIQLLHEHLQSMALHSPPESIHALDIEALRSPDITFWSVRRDSALMGCGALKELDSRHGEIKSMRTVSLHRRTGVAARLLHHILEEARRRSYERLSLETGSMAAFAPARSLYASFGFKPCGAFADYVEDPYSVFMTREL